MGIGFAVVWVAAGVYVVDVVVFVVESDSILAVVVVVVIVSGVVVVVVVVLGAVVVSPGGSAICGIKVNFFAILFPQLYLYVTSFEVSSTVRIFPSTVPFVHSEAFETSKPAGRVERSNVLPMRAISYLFSSTTYPLPLG